MFAYFDIVLYVFGGLLYFFEWEKKNIKLWEENILEELRKDKKMIKIYCVQNIFLNSKKCCHSLSFSFFLQVPDRVVSLSFHTMDSKISTPVSTQPFFSFCLSQQQQSKWGEIIKSSGCNTKQGYCKQIVTDQYSKIFMYSNKSNLWKNEWYLSKYLKKRTSEGYTVLTPMGKSKARCNYQDKKKRYKVIKEHIWHSKKHKLKWLVRKHG